MRNRTSLIAGLCCLLILFMSGPSLAQQPEPDLNLQFSCSKTEGEGFEKVIYADIGEFVLQGEQIRSFRWESSLHRSTHGFDCSLDESDGLQVSRLENGWRIMLVDAQQAREKRGFDMPRGKFCTVRLLKDGQYLQVLPSCATLCGSRSNFSELRIHLPSKKCEYP